MLLSFSSAHVISPYTVTGKTSLKGRLPQGHEPAAVLFHSSSVRHAELPFHSILNI